MADNIKYQVFVSSTYADLAKERRQILEILLMADCIPAGMENFVAQDDEQFNVIKKVIDLCDYYILIIGRRYGSINSSTGLSYTEMEYEYAIEKNIPVLVFALSDDAEIEMPASDEDVIKNGKLAEFRSRAMTNRLASVWKDQSDLMGKVAIAIMKAKNEISRPGWNRGIDEEKKRLLVEIDSLRDENKMLRKSISSDETIGIEEEKLKTSFYGKNITLHFTEIVLVFTNNTVIDHKIEEVTLDNLFKHISVRLTGRHSVKEFIKSISSLQEGYSVNTQDALVAKNRFERLGLLCSHVDDNNNEIIELTDLGRKIMNELNS